MKGMFFEFNEKVYRSLSDVLVVEGTLQIVAHSIDDNLVIPLDVLKIKVASTEEQTIRDKVKEKQDSRDENS